MKVYLVGERARDRIGMAFQLLQERYGDDMDNAIIEVNINGEVVKITDASATFKDAKNVGMGTKTPNQREKHQYWNGYLFQQWCSLRRK